jgi:hypothetical protein
MAAMQWMMGRLKLTVNEAKTQRRQLPRESFDFLGYSVLQQRGGRFAMR